jgi:hypothetical protein
MYLVGLRSVTAAVLSLWLGVLACLLGCAMPAAASAKRAAIGQTVANCPEGGDDAGDSCCQHGRDSSGNPDKSSHHAKSCCPTETALAERKNAPSLQAVSVDLEWLLLPVADESSVVFVNAGAATPTLWCAGRDILRRVHVLRV